MLNLILVGLVGLNAGLVEKKIKKLAPYTKKEVVEDVKQGLKACRHVNLTLSFIKAESDFNAGAVNGRSGDYGIMQINQWHVKKYGYDKKRLVENVKYNMEIGCSIVDELMSKHGVVESVARYNCGYRTGCRNWTAVKAYVKKVLGYKRLLDEMDLELD